MDEKKIRRLDKLLEWVETDTADRKDEQAARILDGLPARTYTDLENDLKNTPKGLRTGYRDLDDIITLPAGALTVIAGRPSHGKSALLQNIFRMAAYREDKPFVFFSYEVDWRQVYIRFLQMESGAVLDERKNYYAFQNYLREGHRDNVDIETAKGTLDGLITGGAVYVLDEAYYVDELAAVVHALKDKVDLGGVFIDYLQLIKPRDTSPTRQVQLQVIAGELRELAKALSIPIVTAAQLNRGPEGRNDRRPVLADMRESGDIEQESDTVLSIFNPVVADVQNGGEVSGALDTTLDVKILKNRNGLVNQTAKLRYNGPTQLITDIEGGISRGVETD